MNPVLQVKQISSPSRVPHSIQCSIETAAAQAVPLGFLPTSQQVSSLSR